jgi:hypothetical protein
VNERDLMAVLGELRDGLSALGEEFWFFEGGASELDYEFHGYSKC